MGPLAGVKIVEVGGIGPAPFCGQMLSDMGADVIRLERRGGPAFTVKGGEDVQCRNRRSLTIDLRKPAGIQ